MMCYRYGHDAIAAKKILLTRSIPQEALAVGAAGHPAE
jgi:hypothetical protein